MRRFFVLLAFAMAGSAPILAAPAPPDDLAPFTFRFVGFDHRAMAFECDEGCRWKTGSVSEPGFVSIEGFIGFGGGPDPEDARRGVRFERKGEDFTLTCVAKRCVVTATDSEPTPLTRGARTTVPARPGLRIAVE